MQHSCTKSACWTRSSKSTSRSSAASAYSTSKSRSGWRPLKWVLGPPGCPWPIKTIWGEEGSGGTPRCSSSRDSIYPLCWGSGGEMGGHEEKPALPSSEFALAVFLTWDHPSWHASLCLSLAVLTSLNAAWNLKVFCSIWKSEPRWPGEVDARASADAWKHSGGLCPQAGPLLEKWPGV